MSHSRLIPVIAEFTTGQPATFTVALQNPGFVPTSWEILDLIYNDPGNATGAVVLSHNQLGAVAVFDAGGAALRVGGRIDNIEHLGLNNGNQSVFTVTQVGGAVVTTLDGTLALLIACSRRAAAH